jgi:hypothetical protein
LAGVRQFNVTSDPVKELRLVPLLKVCDCMTGSRLREVKSLRSMRDVLALGDGHKDAKLI